MNIYFSCSITGGRSDEQTYQKIITYLLDNGHEVPTAHLAEANVVDLEKVVSPDDVFERDIRWLQQCDMVIAEVSTPSHGVGFEIAYALNLGKRVLCLYRKGERVSKMITGNSDPNIQVVDYANMDEAVSKIHSFIKL